MTAEHAIFCSAQITVTMIVAPLGVVAIAANAFAVTAESLCYMPGSASAMPPQRYAARHTAPDVMVWVRRFAYLSTYMGMILMAVMGLVMFVFAPDDVHHVAGGSNH